MEALKLSREAGGDFKRSHNDWVVKLIAGIRILLLAFGEKQQMISESPKVEEGIAFDER